MHALAVYGAWEARLSKPDDRGVPARKHLEAAAKRGSQSAIASLTPPAFPDAVAYLWRWYLEIRRGLGAGMHGMEPLTWAALDAWARRTGRNPEPHEVDALFVLDAVTRNPDAVEV